jgi:hypothetical protein
MKRPIDWDGGACLFEKKAESQLPLREQSENE